MTNHWHFMELCSLLGGAAHQCRQGYVHAVIPSGSGSKEAYRRVKRWVELWGEVESDLIEDVSTVVLILLYGGAVTELPSELRLQVTNIADLSREIIEYGRRN